MGHLLPTLENLCERLRESWFENEKKQNKPKASSKQMETTHHLKLPADLDNITQALISQDSCSDVARTHDRWSSCNPYTNSNWRRLKLFTSTGPSGTVLTLHHQGSKNLESKEIVIANFVCNEFTVIFPWFPNVTPLGPNHGIEWSSAGFCQGIILTQAS